MYTYIYIYMDHVCIQISEGTACLSQESTNDDSLSILKVDKLWQLHIRQHYQCLECGSSNNQQIYFHGN